jgi:benzylsuccinate CoA-transferase BbsF subunit
VPEVAADFERAARPDPSTRTYRTGTSTALQHLRFCDFTGQLAGAGATKWMASFGAEVIRIEDPTNEGRWDLLRGLPPYIDERRGNELSGAFNNHNVGKLGVTLNLRTERGKELLREIVAISDVVTENFAAGVLERLGFGYEELRRIRPDIIYVSNCGFGHVGPYRQYKTWGPIVQAMCGLAFTSGLPGLDPAGYGFSYMDHHGGSFMSIAILSAIVHRNRTGEGQWIDMSCTDAGAAMLGPAVLDGTVNQRPMRREGSPNSNRSQHPAMAPHGIYRCAGHDAWIAIACTSEQEWSVLRSRIGGVALDARLDDLAGRLVHEDELDAAVTAWTRSEDRFVLAASLQEAGIAAAAVAKPVDRIDNDPATEAFGLWPVVEHGAIGKVRVDGHPVHLSSTDWSMRRGAALLGQDNDYVFGELLGLSAGEIAALREGGVL